MSVDVFDFLVEEKTKSKDSLPVIKDIANKGTEECEATPCHEVVDGRADASEHGATDDFHDEPNVEPEDTSNNQPDNGSDDELSDVSEDQSEDEAEVGLEHEPMDHLEYQPGRTMLVHLEESEPEGFYRSMSDSGISMGSGSSSYSGHPRPRLPVLHEEPVYRSFPRGGQGSELTIRDSRWAWSNSSPQPHADTYIPPPCPPPPPAVMYDVPVYPSYPPYTPYGTPPPSTPKEASCETSITIREPHGSVGQSLKPKHFRSFSKVSTRLLLHMQDDIADLESELKQLDEEDDDDTAIRKSKHDSLRSRHDRRERRAREDEIYRELHAKLDNYYHALDMAHKVDMISLPAHKSDLPRYRDWLDSRIMEKGRIRSFIGNDLRTFITAHANVASGAEEDAKLPRTFQPQYLAFAAFLNAVVPLIAFKLFLGVLNRLILLCTIVVAGAVAQDHMRTKIGKDELTCTLLCICISAFAAVFL